MEVFEALRGMRGNQTTYQEVRIAAHKSTLVEDEHQNCAMRIGGDFK